MQDSLILYILTAPFGFMILIFTLDALLIRRINAILSVSGIISRRLSLKRLLLFHQLPLAVGIAIAGSMVIYFWVILVPGDNTLLFALGNLSAIIVAKDLFVLAIKSRKLQSRLAELPEANRIAFIDRLYPQSLLVMTGMQGKQGKQDT